MKASDLITLYDYYYWATKQILAQAERVTPEQWSGPPPIGDRSLQETLFHTMGTEIGWRTEWSGGSHPPQLQPSDFPDATSLAVRWREEEATTLAYLNSLSDDDLQGDFQDVDASYPCRLWEVIVHLAHHGMLHRSEAAMLLTHFGRSPGSIDLFFWLDARHEPGTGG